MGITNGTGNKTRLNLGSGMGTGKNHWKWEGMVLKKTFPLISKPWCKTLLILDDVMVRTQCSNINRHDATVQPPSAVQCYETTNHSSVVQDSGRRYGSVVCCSSTTSWFSVSSLSSTLHFCSVLRRCGCLSSTELSLHCAVNSVTGPDDGKVNSRFVSSSDIR